MSLWDSADLGRVWLVLPRFTDMFMWQVWEGQESGWRGSAVPSYASRGIIGDTKLWSTFCFS